MGSSLCRHAAAPAVLVAAAAAARLPFDLCVYVPISPRSHKDEALALAALETWASRRARKWARASVRFLSPPNATVHPVLREDTVTIPTDVDTDYRRLPIRTFRMWEHLGLYEAERCRWYMKADADSYVNLAAVAARLSCFDSSEDHYFGVTHAVLPALALRDSWPAFFFAHGGSGYLVSQGLMGRVGRWSGPCLAATMNNTDGNAMEDVAFAMCLSNRGVKVQNYGVHSEEFVVNFHQARLALLNASGHYEPSPYWDAQPPPLHGCLLVVHPVERVEDQRRLHDRVSSGRRAACSFSPLQLAKQAEVRLSAHGSEVRAFWDTGQLEALHSCWAGRPVRCSWRDMPRQCTGLHRYPPAATVESCTQACCSSATCRLFQFRDDLGCWLGEEAALWHCEHFGPVSEEEGWAGGAKLEERRLSMRDLRQRGRSSLFRRLVRGLPGMRVAEQDAVLDLYASSRPFRRYCDRLVAQEDASADLARRLLRACSRLQ